MHFAQYHVTSNLETEMHATKETAVVQAIFWPYQNIRAHSTFEHCMNLGTSQNQVDITYVDLTQFLLLKKLTHVAPRAPFPP